MNPLLEVRSVVVPALQEAELLHPKGRKPIVAEKGIAIGNYVFK